MPGRSVIRSAEVVHLARHAAEFGGMTGPVVIDKLTVRRCNRKMIEDQVAIHLQCYREARQLNHEFE
jgi:hypothetical protein